MWNRFDICEAWYLFASEWHKGQGSPEYAIFGRLHNIHFRPSSLLSREQLSRENDSNVRYILASLIRKARRGETVGHA